ncbi:unnamed protein product [Ambrosiozyma monospora]|uniref:Unnamed protein product n=1 Tax=Ambrosiozyma monospora TaxID=43982 RepID=A0ACB5SS83_AMBMO|nr:unnamed protein product [Ambrosiozyma monospora]
MPNLIIVPRSKSLKKIICDTDANTKVQKIINEYSRVNDIDPIRVRFSIVDEGGDSKKPKRRPLKGELTLKENGLTFENTDKYKVHAKDVGAQIGWRTVYFCEYLGPLVIHALTYFGVYDATNVTRTQNLAFILVMLHFLKREAETLFIHTFSAATMPVTYLFRNCGHYWIFSGVLLALSIYAPQIGYEETWKKYAFHVANRSNEELIGYGALWVLFQLSNFYSHYILRQLRSDGSKEHKIPYGFAFSLVSFPNYMFESLAWLVFSVMVNNWSAYLFWFIGTATMMNWAQQKHRKYKKEFGDRYPKNRKAMFPFVF